MSLTELHEAMLEDLDDSWQKTPGFPAYDFTRAFALAAQSLSGDVEAAEDRLDPDLLTGYDLDTYVWQHRGLSRKYGTNASATLRVVSGSGTVHAGDAFQTVSGILFYADETVTVGTGDTFTVTAAEAGAAGNVSAGEIAYMPVTIPGIGSVVNDAAASGGYDDETDDELRGRFYLSMRYPANGGNVAAYQEWAMSVEGVGRAVVVPTPRGPNSVDVYLVDANGAPAGEALVASVQELIDPNEAGDGAGTAPIGAVCTVQAAEDVDVDVAVTIVLEEDADGDTVRAAVEASLGQAVAAAGLSGGILRYVAMANAVMVEGVADFSGLTLNGEEASITVESTEVPVIGEVTVTIGS